MSNVKIKSKNLNVYYGDKQALFDVNLDSVSYTHLRAHETV